MAQEDDPQKDTSKEGEGKGKTKADLGSTSARLNLAPHEEEERSRQPSQDGIIAHHNLLDLPDCVLLTVVQFVSFDEVAKVRAVCKRFDRICVAALNMGFRGAERRLAKCMKRIKCQLPRRQSERTKHPLSRHCDILSHVETNIHKLKMTYMNFVDIDMRRFLPGKVLDEIYKVLRAVQRNEISNQMSLELRDISSMATEHFNEHVLPRLKALSASAMQKQTPGRKTSEEVKKIAEEQKKQEQRMMEQNLKIANLEGLVSSQQALLTEQAQKLAAQTQRLQNLEELLVKSGHVKAKEMQFS